MLSLFPSQLIRAVACACVHAEVLREQYDPAAASRSRVFFSVLVSPSRVMGLARCRSGSSSESETLLSPRLSLLFGRAEMTDDDATNEERGGNHTLPLLCAMI